ncbi:MAG: DUF4214 domain-containing protein [Pyrinomonadaceae bacterium]
MPLPDLRPKSLRFPLAVAVSLSLGVFWLLSSNWTPVASAQGGPPAPFRNFESPQIHPLALTPDGTRLLAVNSPNATLSVFQLTAGLPVLTAEIPVGLEPVSVAARNDREAWVVNWLSDSISIVDLTTGNVVRTIDVGDEPTDVLFAGSSREMGFVCVSGKSQVKVFDPANLNAAPQVIDIFAKQPRALARDGQGGQVFVSVFESGNQTTVIPELIVRQNGGLPAPSPAMAPGLPPAPNTALIVKWNGAAWADETGDTRWDQFVTYTLADIDLVTIDASGQTPALAFQVRGLAAHLGNMAFDSTTGRLFVANQESDSIRRFEPNLRGRFQATRVSILNAGGGAPSLASVQDLNPHIDFTNPAGTPAERDQSLALPADIARASDGTVYLAATSSAKVGFLSSAGVPQGRINVGQGPTGLAMDNARQRLYVLNRFDQNVSIVDTAAKAELSRVPIGFNPEPTSVRAGRRFLYDAVTFSAHGTLSCASCHPGGHRDGLTWDLGDPTGALVINFFPHHPMKGPMMTQSLRGLLNAEPLHWRADRRNISEFNIAFTGLLGSTRLLTTEEMNAFSTFVRTLSYPPNPNQNLDRTFPNPPTGPSAQRGAQRFQAGAALDGLPCNVCHRTFIGLPNFFDIGSDRAVFSGSILQEPQAFKVPQLRGIYQKVGLQRPLPGQPRTEQITGFGFIHDGTFDTILNFLRLPVFMGFPSDNDRRDVEAFLLAFDSGVAPAVGLQVTVNAENKGSPEVTNRINLLMQQSQVPLPPAPASCDLVVRGIYGGSSRGFLRLPNGTFQPDSSSEANLSLQQLLDAVGPGSELTFTGVPLGEGRRFALDRDGNNILNDDELHTSVQIGGRVVDATGNGIPGVTITLSGKQAGTFVTDSLGRFVFNFISTTGTHVITPASAGLSFAPANRSFVNPSFNQSATFVTAAAPNASDSSQFFVRQHYNDFLNREPDAAGLQHWTREIENCGADAICRDIKRQNVSAAFFLSIEFKETGYLVYRTYKASFGDLSPERPVPTTFRQLMTDTQRLGRNVIVGVANWQAQIEANKQAFFLGWVQRPEFLALFPISTTPGDFVAGLNSNAGFVLTQAEIDALVAQLSANNTTQGRAAVVRQLAENAELSLREFNKAFVLIQYFGYLRRNPDDLPDTNFDGWRFWLNKLNTHTSFIDAEMVKSFIVSIEYRSRFGLP